MAFEIHPELYCVGFYIITPKRDNPRIAELTKVLELKENIYEAEFMAILFRTKEGKFILDGRVRVNWLGDPSPWSDKDEKIWIVNDLGGDVTVEAEALRRAEKALQPLEDLLFNQVQFIEVRGYGERAIKVLTAQPFSHMKAAPEGIKEEEMTSEVIRNLPEDEYH